MNWTGGRLQRHSKDPGALQKQRFAKPKSRRERDAQIPQISQNLTQFQETNGYGSEQRTLDGSYKRNQYSNNVHGQSSTPDRTNDKPPQALSRLDRIKRQLLGTNDWAAIGATRPVKMSFTPTEELERFGKRRKLTEADHNRLVLSGGRVSHPRARERARERASSEFGTIENVDIQIHRPRAGPESSSTGYNEWSNESSQPMLLDREESDLVDRSPSTDRGAYGPNRGRTISSQILLSSQNLARQSPFTPSDTSPAVLESPRQDKGQQCINQFSPQLYLEQPSRSPTRLDSSTPSLHQPVPQLPRRFTIDDQIAAELETKSREMRDDHALHQSDITSSYATSGDLSEKKRNEPDLGCAVTLPISSNQCSGWLPEPKHQIQRFVSEIVDSERPTSELGSYASPVKIFAQSVGLDETVEARNQQPVYNIDPHLGSIQNYLTPGPHPNTPGPDHCISGRYITNKANDRSRPFTDRAMRNLDICGVPFTPFRQRLSRHLDQTNPNLLGDISNQHIIYGQHLPSSASFPKATDSRQRSIASSPPPLSFLNFDSLHHKAG